MDYGRSLVDWAGLEPAILSEYGPEPYAYANSATSPPATLRRFYIIRPVAMKKKRRIDPFSKLVRVMARLRSRRGCPWDRKQTHESLLKYLFEEAKEFKS